MKRREFITLIGGAALTCPFAAHAQQAANRPARVGLITGGVESDPGVRARVTALREALAQLGWTEGRNLRTDISWGIIEGAEQARARATALLDIQPDVIVATGAPALAELHKATRTIPVVFVLVTDPVSDGFVASLAHPGGNITGFTIFEHSFAGKWLEMLKEAAPALERVAVMQNPDHPAWPAYLREINVLAPRLGVAVTPAPANNADEITAAFDSFGPTPDSGLILLPSGLVTSHRKLIAELALRHRMPSIAHISIYPAAGGLMSYGVKPTEPYRQAATYVDRILKGAKPADLPVQATDTFELVINLKTAKTIGVSIPQILQVRADEVIE